ncbi:MAG TPA: sulfite exporter TauE/SafE family protein [Bryobacteraceae bacterium]
MTKRLTILALCGWSAAWAHPMGNFSVSHYTKLQTTARGVEVQYALDLAEIPTFELLREWKLDRNSPSATLNQRADKQAREWLEHLSFVVNDKRTAALFDSAQLVIADGAGNLPILRITTRAHVPAPGGRLQYRDENYPGRAGWKEIVIGAGRDISHGLTQYPSDPTVAPPQNLRAEMKLRNVGPVVTVSALAPAPIAPRPALVQPGAVVRGDFLSRLLHEEKTTPWMMLIALLTAFGLGAAHALTPGHGKTIVAAYLVGSRGTLKHAAFLGAMVTFTHTIAVFALGIAVLFLFRYVVPEKVTAWLGAISGLSIVAMGCWMFYKRLRHTRAHAHGHHHHHHDHPEHHHHHEHSHTHMPEKLSWGALAVLGASGGLVPCESALVLLLGAIALGRTGFGLILLGAFSLGLAVVLMAIGALVLYARNLLPVRKTGGSAFFRWVSVASPAAVTIAGLVTTAASLGWIQPV